MEPKTTWVEQRCDVLRLKHVRLRTEEASVTWVKRCILLHHKRHPTDMGASEIRAFLTPLAVHGKVAASTPNGALSAILFLYRPVLQRGGKGVRSPRDPWRGSWMAQGRCESMAGVGDLRQTKRKHEVPDCEAGNCGPGEDRAGAMVWYH